MWRRPATLAGAVIGALACCAGLGACGSRSIAGGSTVTTVASVATATIGVRDIKAIGKVLVTSSGRSLYLLTSDPKGGSGCYGSCALVWPPLLARSKKIKAGPGVDPKLISTFYNHDSQTQVLYNGHALYTYTDDTGPGMATGEGVATYGGVWWLVSPSGKAVKRGNLK